MAGRPPMSIWEHRWWRDLIAVNPDDHETFAVGKEWQHTTDLCWKYMRGQTSVMHHGKTRELRPTLFSELSPNRDQYNMDPYSYFLANGDADPRVGERLGLDGGSVSAPDQWCGNEWCFNPVHTAMIRRFALLKVKREFAREERDALLSSRDEEDPRKVRVSSPMGPGFVPAGEIADDMYWSAARRGALIRGWIEEGGTRRWNFPDGIHWAVKVSFNELLKSAPDPVEVRAMMINPSPLPEGQEKSLLKEARAHVVEFRSWQKSWQNSGGDEAAGEKSGAKLRRRIPVRPVARKGK